MFKSLLYTVIGTSIGMIVGIFVTVAFSEAFGKAAGPIMWACIIGSGFLGKKIADPEKFIKPNAPSPRGYGGSNYEGSEKNRMDYIRAIDEENQQRDSDLKAQAKERQKEQDSWNELNRNILASRLQHSDFGLSESEMNTLERLERERIDRETRFDNF